NNGLIENFKDYVNKAEKLYNSDNHIELFSFAKESINIALKKKDKSHQIYLDQKWDGVFLKANMINIDVRGKIEVIVTGINETTAHTHVGDVFERYILQELVSADVENLLRKLLLYCHVIVSLINGLDE
ncbi:1480_t:CDS:2, partial [Rhizophagus irregularis]